MFEQRKDELGTDIPSLDCHLYLGVKALLVGLQEQ
jgi:hypothetical protein